MMRVTTVAMAFLAIGCTEAVSPVKDVECQVDGDCDDGYPCTRDRCNLEAGLCENATSDELVPDDGIRCTVDSCQGGAAVHDPDDALCDLCGETDVRGSAETCDPEDGCVKGADPLDVDDGDGCTADTCFAGNAVHVYRTDDINDGDPCTDDLCEVDTGEVRNPPRADIDDGDPCTADACDSETGAASHEALDVDDDIDCTVDACDAETGDVTHAPDDSACDDGLFCSGAEACDAELGCQDGPAPDDGIFCTTCAEGDEGPVFAPDDALCGGGTCDGSIDCVLPVGSVTVNELLAIGTDTQGEFLELRNRGDVDVNLARYTIRVGSSAPQPLRSSESPGDDEDGEPAWLPAFGVAWGVPNPPDADDVPEGALFVYGAQGDAPALPNGGGMITLIDNAGEAQDALDYAPLVVDAGETLGASDFPGLAGVSTQLDPDATVADADSGARWCLTLGAAHTAGAPNHACDAFVLNEVYTDHAASGGDSDDEGRTFVELAGPGGGLLAGVRLVRVEGEGGEGGEAGSIDDELTFEANVRMPLRGLFVVADAQDGVTQVANADLLREAGDPENGPDALQLVGAGGALLDALGYGALEATTDEVAGLAMVEGDAAPDVDPESVGLSLARDSSSTDTGDNSADFHVDPSPSPGEPNLPVEPRILWLEPNDALATAGGPTRVGVVDVADHYGAVDDPAGPVVSFGAGEVECAIAEAGVLACDAPPSAAGAGLFPASVANPTAIGGNASLADAFTYTFAQNETGASGELDWCVLLAPASTSAESGTDSEAIYGQVFEAGVTDASSAASDAIVGEVGYGPPGSDPTAEAGWRFFATAPNPAFGGFGGPDDEHAGFLQLATSGFYAYAYRFSLDGGLGFTYCDTNGAGSNAGQDFDAGELGAIEVTEP
ncbi:MAG: hypothetical protein AABZ30_06765 [Myxococcota bacterium]